LVIIAPSARLSNHYYWIGITSLLSSEGGVYCWLHSCGECLKIIQFLEYIIFLSIKSECICLKIEDGGVVQKCLNSAVKFIHDKKEKLICGWLLVCT
jgi:hypothetical protein